MKYLQKEIKLNFKLIAILLLVNIITIGMYYSYALFELSVIENSVVVIRTGTIDIKTEVVGYSDNKITLNSGESKEITINLSNDLNRDVTYKLYYKLNSGDTFSVKSMETFENNVVFGEMNTSKTLKFIIKNTGSSNLSLTLGAQGGLVGFPIVLNEGNELISEVATGKDILEFRINNLTSSSCTPTVVEDGITYFSGTNDCVNFNYVWYSGKLWRITAINPDGTMKMITEGLLTSIYRGTSATSSYETTWLREWLNQEFLPTLNNYDDIIVTDYKWNATATTSYSSKPAETTVVTDAVGMLNAYEYYKSYQNTDSSTGYLNVGYYWWLVTPCTTGDVCYVSDGSSSQAANSSRGVRPSINLKSTIKFNGVMEVIKIHIL